MKKFVVALLLVVGPLVHGIEARSPYLSVVEKIKDRSSFFNKFGDLNPEVVLAVKEITTQRRSEIFDLLVQAQIKSGKTPAEAQFKAVDSDEILSLDLILKYLAKLEELIRAPSEQGKVSAQIFAQKIVDLAFATQVIGQIPAILRLPVWAKGVMHEWRLDLNTPISREATNLWNPSTQKYYTSAELESLRLAGQDLSLLNPPPNSGIWRHPGKKISSINIKEFYYGGKGLMQEGLKVAFPKENVGVFDKVKISQTTPKIIIKYEGPDGKTYKAKMKFGKDLHADITASALFMAIGYPADISHYYRDFKVYFKNGKDISQLKKEWLTYFNGMPPFLPAIHVDDVIKESGRDSGGEFIVFKECVIEADPKGLLRIGPVDFDRQGVQKWRESRAYALLNMWIENADWDPDNTKLILRANNQNDYDFFYVVHDLGCAFGGLLCEKIDRFRGHAVSKVTADEIQFNFRSADDQPMKDEATFADWRWGARLITQLTRDQITAAVEIGGWPESIQKILVEKLIGRRNDFAKVFGLVGEEVEPGEQIGEIPVNLELSTDDGVITNGKITKSRIDGYATNYGEYVDSLVWVPLVNTIKNQLKFGVAKGLCELEKVAVEPVWLGWNKGLIAEVLVSACRDVIKNPNPTSEKDIWLVRDSLKVGLRGGAGIVIAGEVDLVKKYTLVYGARTENEGKKAMGTILNVLLPYQIRRGNLPERYVLLREDMIVPRARLRTDVVAWTGVGAEGVEEQYLLSRSLVANKGDDRLVFYEDTSFHNDIALKLFLDLQIMRIPFFKYNNVIRGRMNGTAWVLKRSDLHLLELMNKDVLSEIVRDGDYSQIQNVPGMQKREIDSTILSSTSWALNLLGFFQRLRVDRQDMVTIRDEKNGGMQVFKEEHIKKNGYNVFGLREQDQIKVRGFLTKKFNSSGEQPFINIQMVMRDSNTKSSELDKGFIKFLNGIYPEKTLNFTADLHSSNKRWGSTEMHLDISYYPEALDILINLDEGQLVRRFIELEDYVDKNKIYRAWHEFHSPDSLVKRGQMDPTEVTFLPGYLEEDLDHLADFILALRKAKVASGQMRVGGLVRAFREAIYHDKNGKSFDSSLFATIHSIVGERGLFISREVTTPYDTENRFPGGHGLQWENIGVNRDPEVVGMVLLPEDVLEVWTMFDWIK